MSVYLLGMLTLAAEVNGSCRRDDPGPFDRLRIAGGRTGTDDAVEIAASLVVDNAGAGGREFAHTHQHHVHHHHHYDHDHPHVHEHDHASLSDEEHARLHAAEIDQIYVRRDGRRRVSFRQLAVLGVSGGIAPCPDALAILLLSAGIGQAAFGMVAIVAFNLGLAAVLVAFESGSRCCDRSSDDCSSSPAASGDSRQARSIASLPISPVVSAGCACARRRHARRDLPDSLPTPGVIA
ncbi:MAG: sulfite exporter TauE/SafE family protein [Thermomicrobiales bacterium]